MARGPARAAAVRGVGAPEAGGALDWVAARVRVLEGRLWEAAAKLELLWAASGLAPSVQLENGMLDSLPLAPSELRRHGGICEVQHFDVCSDTSSSRASSPCPRTPSPWLSPVTAPIKMPEVPCFPVLDSSTPADWSGDFITSDEPHCSQASSQVNESIPEVSEATRAAGDKLTDEAGYSFWQGGDFIKNGEPKCNTVTGLTECIPEVVGAIRVGDDRLVGEASHPFWQGGDCNKDDEPKCNCAIGLTECIPEVVEAMCVNNDKLVDEAGYSFWHGGDFITNDELECNHGIDLADECIPEVDDCSSEAVEAMTAGVQGEGLIFGEAGYALGQGGDSIKSDELQCNQAFQPDERFHSGGGGGHA